MTGALRFALVVVFLGSVALFHWGLGRVAPTFGFGQPPFSFSLALMSAWAIICYAFLYGRGRK